MKNKKILIALLFVFAFLLLTPFLSSAESTSDSFKPTVPKLQIEIPTLQFSKITKYGDAVGLPWLADYIAAIYKYAVGIVSLVAIIMIMVGGLRWMTAGGNSSSIGAAKDTITGAVVGLLLALGSYLVLYSINPDLVTFRELKVKLIQRQELETDKESASTDKLIINASTVCNTIDSCKNLCEQPVSQWPQATANMASPAQVQKIPDTTGIVPRSFSVKTEVISALQKVGSYASQNGYSIQINDGYRTLESQIKKVCDKIKIGKTGDIGKTVAWPGGSRHGIGIAVDVYLIENGNVLTSKNMSQEKINKLEELMRQGGFVRYCPEWWHFEIGTAGTAERPKDLNSFCPRS